MARRQRPYHLLVLVLISGVLIWTVSGVPLGAQQQKILVIAQPSDIQNLDPTLSSADIPTQEMLTNIYLWLINYKIVERNGLQFGDADQFVGDLAESYTVSPDGKTVTFKLRPGLKFSNGDALTADTVKFTYNRIFDQGAVTAALTKMAAVAGKDSVQKVNERTVVFKVDKGNPLLFGNMAQFGHSILNMSVVKPKMTPNDPYAHEWLKANTNGNETGPFVLEKWAPGSEWVFARNPHYYGKPTWADRVIFKVIPDASNRLAQIKQGSVDVAYEIARKDLAALQNDKNVTVYRFPSRFVVFLGMNSKIKPFDNKKVRQAVSYAVPYDVILKEVLKGFGRQLTSPIPFGTPTHTDEFFKYKQDFAKAKALLKEAGFPKGFKATLAIASGSEEGKEVAVWVQSALRNIGVDVTIQEMPGAAFTEKLQKHEHAFFFFNNWISINNDPFYHLFWLFRSDCCNYTNYDNKQVWKLIDDFMLTTDRNARAAAAKRAQRIIVDDAPWVFLYQPDHVVVTRSNVKGYVYFSADRFTRYQYLQK